METLTTTWDYGEGDQVVWTGLRWTSPAAQAEYDRLREAMQANARAAQEECERLSDPRGVVLDRRRALVAENVFIARQMARLLGAFTAPAMIIKKGSK